MRTAIWWYGIYAANVWFKSFGLIRKRPGDCPSRPSQTFSWRHPMTRPWSHIIWKVRYYFLAWISLDFLALPSKICKSQNSDRRHKMLSQWESRKELWHVRVRDAGAWGPSISWLCQRDCEFSHRTPSEQLPDHLISRTTLYSLLWYFMTKKQIFLKELNMRIRFSVFHFREPIRSVAGNRGGHACRQGV